MDLSLEAESPKPITGPSGHLAIAAGPGKFADHSIAAVTCNAPPSANFPELTATQLSYRLAQMTTELIATALLSFL
jgi:hypothetical protein